MKRVIIIFKKKGYINQQKCKTVAWISKFGKPILIFYKMYYILIINYNFNYTNFMFINTPVEKNKY